MALILPPFCPYCLGPLQWKEGLVFHPDYVHYKAVQRADGPQHWQMLATIVERKPSPALMAAHCPSNQARLKR